MVVHGSHTWFHVHPGSNGPCCGENRRKTCVIGHGRRKPRPNDHSVCNPGQKNGNGPQRDGNGSFRSEILYMASAHGTMSIRVETNHARVKIDEKRGL